MQLFHEIPDAAAIVRQKGGVFKQAKVFHRNGRLYVGAAGGFVRICAKFGDTWGTSAPNVSVVDISQDVPGMFVTGEPRYTAPAEWKGK